MEIQRVSSRQDSQVDVIIVPLKTLNIRSVCYVSKSPNDITLGYDRKSQRLQLNALVEGKPKEAFILSRISGEALFLDTIAGSLDDMVVKLLLETTSKVEVIRNNMVEHVRCSMIVATANVEETGRIRELLMSLPSKTLMQANNKLRLQEGIPHWSSKLPWWLYSKKLRVLIQQLIVLYAIFNTVWALWQLYRHVDFIQDYLEPKIALLREACHVYLSDVINLIDSALEVFTDLRWKFLSPFKVLLGPLITPLQNLLWYLAPSIYKLASPIVGLANSVIYIVTLTGWLIWFLASTLIRPIWLLLTTIICPIFTYILYPVFDIIQRVPGLTKGGIDPVKALVRNVLLNSFKSVYHLLTWITRFGKTYHRKSQRSTDERKILRRNTVM